MTVKLNDIDELNFSLPFEIEKNHILQLNKHIEMAKVRYLIKVVFGQKIYWFFIESIEDDFDENRIRNYTCKSIIQMMSGKPIRAYEEVAVGADKPVGYALSQTNWTLDYMDADFKLSRRSFEYLSSNALEMIFDVGEKYNAINLFDTDKKTLSVQKPELTGINRGFTVDYGKLMQSMNRVLDSSQIVTRFYGEGSEGLTFQNVNPSGRIYIDDYSYWMFPFERDANRNVIQHSAYMSDSLCHAILDYQALIESKTGLFKSYLDQLRIYQKDYDELFIEYNKLKNDQAVIEEIEITQQYDQKMFYEKYNQNGGRTERIFKTKPDFAYAFFIRVANNAGMNIAANGTTYSVPSGKWTYLTKFRGFDQTNVVVTGGSGEVFIQLASISLEEYNGFITKIEIDPSGNQITTTTQVTGNDLVEKYSLNNKQNQIALKQAQIDSKLNQIAAIQSQINVLQKSLSEANNFTPAQLYELNESYIYFGSLVDDIYIDAEDLFEATQEKFKEVRVPSLEIGINLVNFLEVVEEQINWKKLYLGDFTNIKYTPFGVSITARITEITYDFEQKEINLTLSNAKDVNDDSKRLEKFLNNTSNTNITVDSSKSKWTEAITNNDYFSRLFDQFYDKITNQINMSINNTVTINNMGITVTDPNDPLRFIRITNGQIGITRSGGLRYETALDAYGIIAETVYGKIILGQRVVIGSDDGIFTIEGPTATIEDRCQRVVSKYGLLSENPDVFGIMFNRYRSPEICSDLTLLNTINMTSDRGFYIDRIKNGVTTTVVSLDNDGWLNAIGARIKESFITDGEIRGGSLWIGDEDSNYILRMNIEGLWLGHKYFEQAPFSVDLNGHLKAHGADFSDSIFVDGDITGSTVTVGSGENIIKLDPSIGFWAGASNFDNAPASIGLDGTAKFKKLIVTDGDGELLIDSENKVVNANGFDFVGVGALETDLLSATIVTADDGNITDLIAGKLSTLTNAALTGYSNYITISGKDFKFITGRVSGQGTQKTLSDGRKLYWVSSTKTGKMTTETTPYPVMMYQMEEKEKLRFYFEGSGEAAYPIIKMGEGGGGNNSIGYIRKPATSFEFEYLDNFGSKKNLIFNDDTMQLETSRKNLKLWQSVKNSFIDLKDDGSLVISNNGGVSSITLSPTGVVTIKGTRINLDA